MVEFVILRKENIYAALFYHTDNTPCSTLPVQSLGPQDGATSKKRRRRRRKARPEGGGGAGGRREDSGEEFSEDEDMFTIDLSSDEEKDGDNSRCVWGHGVQPCLITRSLSISYALLVQTQIPIKPAVFTLL